MASSTASSQPHGTQNEDVHAAIAKAVELRSLHAALLQRSNLGSPAVLGPHVGASPSLLRRSNPLSTAEDYPVFAPSYEEEPLRAYHSIHPENRSLSGTWRAMKPAEGKQDESVNIVRNEHSSPYSERNICFTTEQHFSKRSSCVNHNLQASLVADALNSSSSRTSPGYETIATCNACKPPTINREYEIEHKNLKAVTSIGSLHDSEPPTHAHTKHRGPILSWLFPRLKKKPKPEMSPNPIESEDMAQLLKDWGLLSLESAKKEVFKANKNRDAALAEVSEMRSSLGELQQKLVNLETYCEELKKALKQAKHAKNSLVLDRPSLPMRTKFNGSIKDNTMTVSHEVMAEGFLQMVSEARLSVKQFCEMLIHQIEETGCELMEKLKSLLQPHQMAPPSNKHSKALLHHVEALINQSLYQDFENCVFQKNGSPKFLDPQQDRQENFSSFISLRNLSWNEVLRKGTKYYSEDFSRFCDQKMSCIVSLLNSSRAWPEQLLHCFFVAAKCIWLLHLLAFSFGPPLMILRVEENQNFDPLYMEDIPVDRKTAQIPGRVKIMVMPGFYIQDSVLKCRVLCRYQ
ncbi:unnamed protein product [Musa acuminata subsp. burmannicoides]